MDGTGFHAEQVAAGWLLISSGLIFAISGTLYTGRAIWKWPAAGTVAYLRWERSFVIAALLTAVVGFTILERVLESAGDRFLAPSGITISSGRNCGLHRSRSLLSRPEGVARYRDRGIRGPGFSGSGGDRSRIASHRSSAGLGWMGNDPLEPGLDGRAANRPAARYVLSLASLCCAAPDRDCTPAQELDIWGMPR